MRSRAIGMMDQFTSAAAGPSMALSGRSFELGTSGKLNTNDFVPIEIVANGTGITSGATIKIETAPRAAGGPVTWTEWGSDLVFNNAGTQTHKRVGKLNDVYIRARVSGYTDGTYSVYCKII